MTGRVFVLIAATTAALVLAPAAAADSDEARATVSEIHRALKAQPAALPAIVDRTGPQAPVVGSQDLQLRGGGTLGLPARGAGTDVGATTVYDATGHGSDPIAVQQLGLGTRALINIDGRTAPERFEFRMGGSVSRLQLNRDGSVAAYNTSGDLVGGFAAPWAVDAAGRPVATHFVIDGTTLVQIVKHRTRAFDYGVTADPVWLGLAIRACLAVRCYRWMPGYIQRQFLHGHITPAVVGFLRAWFCARTWIC